MREQEGGMEVAWSLGVLRCFVVSVVVSVVVCGSAQWSVSVSRSASEEGDMRRCVDYSHCFFMYVM